MRINYISNALGIMLKYISSAVFVPVFIAIFYKEWNLILPFFTTAIMTLLLGKILRKIVKNADDVNALNDIRKSEALVVASFSWFLFGVVAAIPYLWCGINFIDALFEGVAGTTTVGATILQNFNFPKTILFWRSLTQWFGGMGIIVLFVAILPQFAVAGRQMFFAEAPGPTEDKLTPRIKNTASALWIVYAGLTLICTLCLVIAGMPLFDSICNAMSTLSAGGLCPHPQSIGGYNSVPITVVIMCFMFLAGANFVLQSRVLTKRDITLFWKNEEFRFYVKSIFIISFLLILVLYFKQNFTLEHSLIAGIYQTLTFISATGSASEDYGTWTYGAKILLYVALFLSSCSGSTGGGIKLTRWLLLFKYMKNELYKVLHPNAVLSVKIDEKVVPPEVLKQTIFFIFCFLGIFLISAAILTVTEQNITIGISSALASLGNMGPGFGNVVGPMGNYSSLHVFSKFVFILNMLIGRLEIVPFIVLFHKDVWNLKK